MIEKLTLKQKIIGGIILSIIIIIIAIIMFIFSPKEEEFDLNQIVQQSQEDGQTFTNENGKKLDSQDNSVFSKDNQINNSQIKNQNLNNEGIIQQEDNKIIVHITGEVKKTGILILEDGARIADAIKAAGGETKQADLDEVNLAYELQDGQKIYIPNKNDKKENTQKEYITSESGNNVVKQGNNDSQGGNKKVNINEATQTELENLPGIGPSIASRIIEYREQNGKFQKIEDLQNVKGIGDAKYANIKDYVIVK